MKKKFLLGLLLAAASLSLLFCMGITNAQEFVYEDLETDIIYRQNSYRSIEVYSEAMDSFTIVKSNSDGTSSAAYSDDFAGVFMDDKGYLNIGVAESEDKIYAAQNQTDFGGQVVYRQQRFSYNYLQQIKEAISSIMIDYGILGVGIKQSRNQVDVDLHNDIEIGRIISYLQQKGLYEESALNFIITPGGGATANSSVYGGDRITGNKWGTVCVNAVDNETGKTGIITNQHVALSDEKYVDGKIVGTSTKSQRSGTVDAAFIPFENQNSWSDTTYAKNYSATYKNIRLGEESMIIENRPVLKIGQTTGITVGRIEYSNKNANINYGDDFNPDWQIINRSFQYTNISLHGDSGGPIYFDDENGNLFLIGLHFGGSLYPERETYGIACRITEVMRTLDITPITNDSYDLTSLSDTAARIDGISYSPSGLFNIPAELGGKQITDIGAYTFAGKSGLTNINIPDTVSSIGSFAFEGCAGIGSLGHTLVLPPSVKSIGSGAFSRCSRLNIVVPATVESIAPGAFSNCTDLWLRWDYNGTRTAADLNLTKVITDTYIYDTNAIMANAFSGCTNLGGVFIPPGVTSIESGAFSGCKGLTVVEFNAASRLASIGAGAFSGCSSLIRINIPESVTSIGAGAFSSCGRLTVFLSRPAPATENSSFLSVKGIVVPDGIINTYKTIWPAYSSKIYQNSGVNGSFLIVDSVLLLYLGKDDESVSIPEGVTSIGSGAFRYAADLTAIAVPDSVTYIGDYAFADCRSLKSITFGSGVSAIGRGIISGSGEVESIVSVGGPVFKSLGNCLIRKSNNTLVLGCKTSVIPGFITGIESYAFHGCSGLESIVLPSNAASIGEYAFYGCSNLKSVTFGSASQLRAVGSFAFSGCSSMTSITIPDKVKNIGRGAFSGCSNLASVYIAGKLSEGGAIELETYASSVFGGCTYLDFIIVPDSATALHYKTDDHWSEFASKIFVKNQETDSLNWVLITDADYEDPSLKGFLFLYELTAVYANVMEVSHEYIAQIVMDNHYAGLIFYAKMPQLSSSIMNVDISIMCSAGEIGTAIIVNENGIYSFPEAVVARDMYSLGYCIATEYARELGKDYLQEVYDRAGWFPVMAPHFYNSVYFLMGMSEVFGFPITVMSKKEEIEQTPFLYSSLEIGFDNWLLIDPDIMARIYGNEGLDMFESMGMDVSNAFIFGKNPEYLENIRTRSENVFIYEYKISLLEEILLSLCNWYDWGEVPEHGEWIFDAVSYWESMGYFPEDDSWYSNWWSYWESTGYNLDYDSWFSYWSSYWALSGYQVPGYDSWFDEWLSNWEYHRVYLVEQVVIRL